MSNTINEIDIIDVYKLLHLSKAEDNLLNAYRILAMIDHILDGESQQVKIFENINHIDFEKNRIKTEVNNRKLSG